MSSAPSNRPVGLLSALELFILVACLAVLGSILLLAHSQARRHQASTGQAPQVDLVVQPPAHGTRGKEPTNLLSSDPGGTLLPGSNILPSNSSALPGSGLEAPGGDWFTQRSVQPPLAPGLTGTVWNAQTSTPSSRPPGH